MNFVKRGDIIGGALLSALIGAIRETVPECAHCGAHHPKTIMCKPFSRKFRNGFFLAHGRWPDGIADAAIYLSEADRAENATAYAEFTEKEPEHLKQFQRNEARAKDQDRLFEPFLKEAKESGLPVDEIIKKYSADDARELTKPEHGWTCFHCGKTYHDVESAKAHFGVHEDAAPACQITDAELRSFRAAEDQARLISALADDCERLQTSLAEIGGDITHALIRQKLLVRREVDVEATFTVPKFGVSDETIDLLKEYQQKLQKDAAPEGEPAPNA